MAAEVLFGGVGSVIIEEIGGDWTTPLLTIDRFTAEAQNWPKPQALTDQLSDGQEGSTGQEVPFSFRGVNLDGASVDAVRLMAFALTEVLVRFISKDGAKTMTLAQCLLQVETSSIAEIGKYGSVLFAGKAVTAGSAKAYTLS